MASTTTTYTVTVLENCRVSPPPAAVSNTRIPLTFFDVWWITFHPMSRVLFFDIQCSKTTFSHTIIPTLKNSLSIALKHYFPLAGNLITPSNIIETNPEIRYVDGDSISLTFAECSDADFDQLSGNHARDADDLVPLVPHLHHRNDVAEENCIIAPVFAVQVTLFPNQGITIGLTHLHVVADGSTMFNFIQTWSLLAKQLDTQSFKLPLYDRTKIKDPKGITAIYRMTIGELMKQHEQQRNNSQNVLPAPVSVNKVRATFFMYEVDIQALKRLVIAKLPKLPHVSTITVVCAYLWTCMAKTRAAVGDNKISDEDEAQHFGISVDCRARLEPPLPSEYFGNCIVPSLSHGKGVKLVGEEGFLVAAELIGEAIYKKLHNAGGILEGAEVMFKEFEGAIKGEWAIGVAGSPHLDYYNIIDYGFGKPQKFVFVTEPLSLSRCKNSKGGDIEIGLCLPKNEMDVFPSLFATEIRDLCNNLG